MKLSVHLPNASLDATIRRISAETTTTTTTTTTTNNINHL
jgi:hypothetical protein